jgi:hypothetical protein
MKSKNALKFIAATAGITWAAAAFAHPGHAEIAFHWHSTDALGLALVAVLAAAALYLATRR